MRLVMAYRCECRSCCVHRELAGVTREDAIAAASDLGWRINPNLSDDDLCGRCVARMESK